MKSILITIICACFLVSCGKEEKRISKAERQSSLEVKENMIIKDRNLSDLIKLDSLIPLETNEKSVIGEVTKVKIHNDRIYILDESISNSLFCFDNSGKYISQFKNVGRGPNEYTYITDFDCYNEFVYVTADYGWLFKLDKNLNFIERIKVGWPDGCNIGNLLCVKDDETIILGNHRGDYKFYFLDLKTKEVAYKVSPVIGEGNLLMGRVFSVLNNGSILVTVEHNDTVFYLTKHGLSPYRIIDFQYPVSHKQQLEIMKSSWMKAPIPPVTSKMRDMFSFYETDSFLTFEFIYQNRLHYYMYDIINNQVRIIPNDLRNDVFGAKYFPYYKGFHKHSIIVSVDAIDLLKNKTNLKVKIPEGLTESSNPVLVFFHPK